MCKKAHKKKYGFLIFSYFTTYSKLIKIREGHLHHFPCKYDTTLFPEDDIKIYDASKLILFRNDS